MSNLLDIVRVVEGVAEAVETVAEVVKKFSDEPEEKQESTDSE